VSADIGESDVFATTCDATTTNSSASVLEQIGPVQAMAFIVPGASSQRTISAEAAREVFGLGGNNGATAPWKDPRFFYVRSSQTGTTQMIGRAIGVPATSFWGVLEDSASGLAGILQSITVGADAEQSIGLLSVDYYDIYRGNGILRALAFKASGQECAYLPDSNEISFDKQNVRDGHYPIWGPLHLFAQNPPSPQAEAFLLTLNESQGVLDAFIRASLVPQCAMSVARSSELGPLQAATPSKACGCYFEMMTDPAKAQPADCKTCMTRADCPANRPACNYGFCEVN
jgi:ABC-type phosphate transport system substrate-binding protein